ncbi:hypothetical protein A2V49_03680 [candidate division WWE3 bacterium RBG_19FT_COMBO_34_6]|uniref:Uncharacterized protein n=1 Tax=candidate division WWE3 bacterium RBG_19FT_COMBO_34_6 TaxID=1802612 RepID=A0A1F4UKS2_UNCKA|nr:MAG: hypothetical protein A2V49_03680 [candidate division WWE3 bacterium RBG_19FT_COMBO_34_6]
MKIIEAFKTFGKDDFKFIVVPTVSLVIFLIIVGLFFPKPSQIYRNGVLTSCKCLGFKSIPRTTKGSLVGDEYCFGIPISCEKTQILKKDIK